MPRRRLGRGVRATAALGLLGELPVIRYPHAPLVRRAFQLRDDVTAYGAVYLALAEGAEGTLLTPDARLAAVPACGAAVAVVGG